MTSKIIVNTIEADTGISSVTFASNINLQNDSSILVSSSGIRLGTGSTIAAPSANEITLSTNSAERFRVDSAGHVRVNTGDLRVGDNTDSNAGTQTISVGSVSSGSGGIGIFANPTNGNSWVQFGDGTSGSSQYRGYMNYQHGDDSLRFGTASSEALRIDSGGRMLLGTTTAGNGNADNLTLADSGNCGITIRSGTSNFGEIYFSDATSGAAEYDGYIAYSHSSRYMVLATAQTERLRITSAGRMGVGTNDPNALLEVRDSENTTQGNAQIRISKGVGNGAAPTSVSRVNSYLHIGGSEYHTSFGKYNIAFGYTNDEVGSGIPAYIGFTETTLAGYTKGDLIFGTRGTTGATDNPTERMRIDSNGVITMPAQPAFHSRGGTTLSASTNNVIIGGATEFNTGGHYSTSNGRFTAPVDGVYQFSFWGLLYVHSSGVINIFYTKNGTQYAHIVQGGADSTNHTSRSGTVLMDMSAGDYAELRINPASTGANAYGSQWNMSGHLVG